MTFEPTKIPAILGIEEKMYENVVKVIDDESNFMFLGKGSANHEEVLLFALALGIKHKTKMSIEKYHSAGFIRSSSFTPKLSVLIDALHFREVGFDNPDALCDHKHSFQVLEEYANGGFHLLQGEIEGNPDSETYANELVAEMNKWHKKLFEDMRPE